MSEKHIGEVVQVTGPVLDIRFPEGELPALLNAIEIDNHGEKLVVEVAQQTGDNMVRCIAMKSTDGLVRGTKAVDTGGPIAVPVGEECLGRVFNLLGETVDNKPAPETAEKWPIHRDPRPMRNRFRQRRSSKPESRSLTDLPVCQGRKNRSVRWCRRWKNSPYHGADPQRGNGTRRTFCFHRCRRAYP